MPRGSKPGERRGGRQKGTPNKKTVLRDAALNAAAANPNLSPLDFLLGLMRNPDLPSDLRIRMAEVAAPFVHRKPKNNLARKYGALLKVVNAAKTKAGQPAAPMEEAVAEKQSPLDYLLSVMRDANTEPEVRIRVARRVVPFVYAKAQRDRRADEAEAQIERLGALGDEFIVDPELAARLRDDTKRRYDLVYKQGCKSMGPLTPAEIEEMAVVEARMEETAAAIECPKGYGREEAKIDQEIVDRFARVPKSRMTKLELALEAQSIARIAAYGNTPAMRANRRIVGLHLRRGAAEFTGKGWTSADQEELDRLEALYPLSPPDPEDRIFPWRR